MPWIEQLKAHIDTARLVANTHWLQSGDLEATRELARDVARTAGGHFALIDRDLRHAFNTRKAFSSPGTRTANPGATLTVFNSGQPNVGNLQQGTVSDALLFTIRVPVVSEGVVKFVLGYTPGTTAIRQLVEGAAASEGWFAAVIDGNDRIVARSYKHDEFFGKRVRPDRPEKLTVPNGILARVDLEGRPSVGADYSSAIAGWRAVVWVTKDVLEQPRRNALRLASAFSAAALLISVALAGLIAWGISTPVRKLAQSATTVGSGSFAAFAETPFTEINLVGMALRNADEQIAARQVALARLQQAAQRQRGDAAPSPPSCTRRGVYLGHRQERISSDE